MVAAVHRVVAKELPDVVLGARRMLLRRNPKNKYRFKNAAQFRAYRMAMSNRGARPRAGGRMSLAGETLLPPCTEGLSSQGNGETAVAELIRLVVDQASEAVRNLALADLETPAGAAAVTAKLVPLLEWERLGCESADDQQTLPVGCHRPDPEPVAPEIDNWARGAIPLKTLVFALTSSVAAVSYETDPCSWTTPEAAQGDCPSAPTGTQVTTLRGSAGNLGRRITEHGTDGRVGAGGHGEGWEIGFTMLPANENDDLVAGYGGVVDAITRGSRLEERMFLEGLRLREESRAREAKDKRERVEREEKDALQRSERLAKEHKGREWVWGVNGEVLILDKVPPESIPVPVVPRIGIRDIAGGDGVSRGAGGVKDPVKPTDQRNAKAVPRRASGGRGGKDGRQAARKDGAASRRKSCSETFFEVAATFQPPLLDSLEPQAGVCILEGGDKKEGPAFQEDHQHMSRGEFISRELPMNSGSATIGGGGAHTRDDLSLDGRYGRGAIDVPPRPLSPPATFPLGSHSFGMERLEMAHSLPLSKVAGRKITGGDLIDTVRILDPLAGAAPVGEACTRVGHGDGRGAGRMVTLTQPGPAGFGVGPDDELADDPHWLLFKEGGSPGRGGGGGSGGSVDAGEEGSGPVPPPLVPRKPGSRPQRGLHHKLGMRRPRDRGNRLVIPTVARKHLASPPFGDNMSHGAHPPRYRTTSIAGDGQSVDSVSLAPAPPSDHPARDGFGFDPRSTSHLGSRRKLGSGGEGGGYSTPRKGGGGGLRKFPPIPVQITAPLGGKMGRGSRRRGRRGSSAAHGWISSRQPQETLKQLLST